MTTIILRTQKHDIEIVEPTSIDPKGCPDGVYTLYNPRRYGVEVGGKDRTTNSHIIIVIVGAKMDTYYMTPLMHIETGNPTSMISPNRFSTLLHRGFINTFELQELEGMQELIVEHYEEWE